MHSLYTHRFEAVTAAFFVIVVILVIFAACSNKLRHCRTRDARTADASCNCCCGLLPWRSSPDNHRGYKGESGTGSPPDNSGGVLTIAGSSPSAPPPVTISGNTIHVAPEAMGELVKGSNPSFSGFKINNRFRSADTSSKRATAEAVYATPSTLVPTPVF